MRTDEALKCLRESGTKGITTEELSNKFGFKYQNSVSKIIRQLRERGHAIDYDKNTGIYVLIAEAEVKTSDGGVAGNSVVDREIYEENPDDTEDNDDDALFHRRACKSDKILEYLTRAGKEGASSEDLSKYAGTKSNGIGYHIHVLRKKGFKILLTEGRYFIKISRKTPRYNIGTKELPPSTIPVDILNLLGDKRLVNDIHKLRKEELPTYMDFLKKIIFYTKCALSMHETHDMLDTIKIGDEI